MSQNRGVRAGLADPSQIGPVAVDDKRIIRVVVETRRAAVTNSF